MDVQFRARGAPRAATVLIAALVLAGVAACLPVSHPDPTQDCAGPGAQPPGEPGDGTVLLTVGGGGSEQLVLYSDGWVLSQSDGPGQSEASGQAGAMVAPLWAPAPPSDHRWQPAYLGACQLDEIRDLAQQELDEDADLGHPDVTDAGTTVATYYEGDETTKVSAYALGYGDSGVSRADRRSRAALTALIDVLAQAPQTGETLPVQRIQISLRFQRRVPSDWPGPPMEEILQGEDCGVVTGAEARELHEYLTTDYSDTDIMLAVLPPGMPGCAQ